MDGLKAYKRQILLGYTVAGVAASLISLLAVTRDLQQNIPTPEALVFLAIMVTPMCIGNIIARDVSSLADSWSPFAHVQALRNEAPITLAALACIFALDVAIYFAGLPSLLMVLPTIAGGFFLDSRLRNP